MYIPTFRVFIDIVGLKVQRLEKHHVHHNIQDTRGLKVHPLNQVILMHPLSNYAESSLFP